MEVVSVNRAQAKQYLETLKSRQGDPSTIKTLTDQLAQPNRTTFEVPKWLTAPAAPDAVLKAARPLDAYQGPRGASPAADVALPASPGGHPAVSGLARPSAEALNLRALNAVRGPERKAELGRAQEIFETSIGGTGHQFLVDGGLGNRVMSTESLPAAVDALGASGQRALYSTFHLQDTLQPAVIGVKHTVGLSAAGPGKSNVVSSWPGDYGDPANSPRDGDYAGHLISVNYQGGVALPLPAAEQRAYKSNADQWDALTHLVSRFATDEGPVKPLAIRDQASVKQLASDVSARLDPATKLELITMQSTEGQFAVANLGPQESTLLKRSLFEKTNVGRLINEFQRAPGLTPQTPEKGWEHLAAKGLITRPQLERVRAGGLTSVMLQWLPEETRGWQAFKPTEPEALTASPQNLTNLLWSEVQRVAPLAAMEALIAKGSTPDPLGLDNKPFRAAIEQTIRGMGELRAVVQGSAQDPVYDEFVRRLKTSRTPAEVTGALRDAEAMYRVRARTGADDKYLPSSAFVAFAQGAPGTNSSVYQYVATAVPGDLIKAR